MEKGKSWRKALFNTLSCSGDKNIELSKRQLYSCHWLNWSKHKEIVIYSAEKSLYGRSRICLGMMVWRKKDLRKSHKQVDGKLENRLFATQKLVASYNTPLPWDSPKLGWSFFPGDTSIFQAANRKQSAPADIHLSYTGHVTIHLLYSQICVPAKALQYWTGRFYE